MPIDIHDLSAAAYTAVLENSRNFHAELEYQFILLTAGARHEKGFLKAARRLCYAMLQYDDEQIREIIFEDIPSVAHFQAALRSILSAIKVVEAGIDAAPNQ